jgi:hypothetical protein
LIMGEAKRRKAVLGDAYGTPCQPVQVSLRLKQKINGVDLPQPPAGAFLLEATTDLCKAEAICVVRIDFDAEALPDHSIEILRTKGRWTTKAEALLEKALIFVSGLPEAQRIDYGQVGGYKFWAEAVKEQPGRWKLYGTQLVKP